VYRGTLRAAPPPDHGKSVQIVSFQERVLSVDTRNSQSRVLWGWVLPECRTH